MKGKSFLPLGFVCMCMCLYKYVHAFEITNVYVLVIEEAICHAATGNHSLC